MPIYNIECKTCKRVEYGIVRDLEDFRPFDKCCGKPMELFRAIYGHVDTTESKRSRNLHAPAIISDIKPYKSQVTGEMVSSRSRHNEILKERNLIEVGNETEYLVNNSRRNREERIKKDATERKQQIADIVNAKT